VYDQRLPVGAITPIRTLGTHAVFGRLLRKLRPWRFRRNVTLLAPARVCRQWTVRIPAREPVRGGLCACACRYTSVAGSGLDQREEGPT